MSDLLLNPDQNFNNAIDTIVDNEDRVAVDRDELIFSIALTVFGIDMQNMANIFQNYEKSIEIEKICIQFLSQEMGVPVAIIQTFIDKARISMEILARENRPNMIIMPIMTQLNIWTADNSDFAMQDTLYATVLSSYIGKWKKITQIYTLE